jgi:uncharacterized membrane protein YphA (DoxX/SURF4 family)
MTTALTRRMAIVALGRGAGLALGLVLVWAGLGKMVAPERFVDAIVRLDLVAAAFVDLVGAAVTVAEILVGLALVFGWRRQGVASVAVALIAVFTLAVVASALRGIETACGCFGDPSVSAPGWIAARNTALVGLGLLARLPAPSAIRTQA